MIVRGRSATRPWRRCGARRRRRRRWRRSRRARRRARVLFSPGHAGAVSVGGTILVLGVGAITAALAVRHEHVEPDSKMSTSASSQAKSRTSASLNATAKNGHGTKFGHKWYNTDAYCNGKYIDFAGVQRAWRANKRRRGAIGTKPRALGADRLETMTDDAADSRRARAQKRARNVRTSPRSRRSDFEYPFLRFRRSSSRSTPLSREAARVSTYVDAASRSRASGMPTRAPHVSRVCARPRVDLLPSTRVGVGSSSRRRRSRRARPAAVAALDADCDVVVVGAGHAGCERRSRARGWGRGRSC